MTRFDDLTDSQKTDKKARFNILSDEIDAAVAGDSTIATKVEALETAVGDATTADTLVYDVADIKTYISEILTANSLTDPRANAGNGEE